MAYSAIAVANAFIEKAKARGIKDLSPMKLQKLVYFSHAWMLAIDGTPLIKDPVKAWRFGPVIDSVYHEFKSFGSQNITQLGTEYESSGDGFLDFKYVIPLLPKADTKVDQILDAILDTYGDLSAVKLSNLTHEPGSAWSITEKEHLGGEQRGYIISNDIIKDSMRNKLGL